MNPEYVAAITALWVNEFGAESVTLESKVKCMDVIRCYKIGDTYIRLDSFSAVDEGINYCIEAATLDEAQNNVFDDAWTYWDGDGIDNILAQMREDLKNLDETAQ